jgi:hypothetical protein
VSSVPASGGSFYSSGRSVGALRWRELGTAAPLGAAAPTIHRHSSWTLLMLAPWSVVSWYARSVPPDSTLCRCGRISWSGRIYSKSCDAPPLVGDAQDCFRVAVGGMQMWARGSKCFLSHPLDQTDITTVNPTHTNCVCGWGNRRDSDRGRVQGQPHQLGRPHLLIRPHQQGQPHLLVRRTYLEWSSDSLFIPNAYLQVKIPTQLVELY